jgi:MOSC domain-containing protein YiiM
MQKIGKILKLFESHLGKIERVECKTLKLDKKGVMNDKFYNKDIERSVLISSIDSYELAKYHNIEMKYGELGENIIVDFNPYKFPSKFQIQIGGVILEISQHCTLCKSLSKIDSKLPKLLKNDRGVFVKVIKAGVIDKNSQVIYEEI